MIAPKITAPALLSLGLVTLAWNASAQPAPLPSEPPADGAPAEGSPSAPQVEDDRGPVQPARVDPAARARARAEAADAKDTGSAPRAYLMPVVEQPREEPAPQATPPKPHIQRWSAGLAFMGSAVNSPGYDPYSKTNALPMFSLFGTFTPWPTRPVSVNLAFEWDYGGASATARGNDSSLDIHRLAVGIEGRYTPISRMMLFVRAMPAAMHLGATIQDRYLGNTLVSESWIWGADVTGGAAARLGAVGHPDMPACSFWLGLDMGYRFAPSTEMRFRPGNLTEDDQTRHFGEVALPNIDLSGFVGRLSMWASF